MLVHLATRQRIRERVPVTEIIVIPPGIVIPPEVEPANLDTPSSVDAPQHETPPGYVADRRRPGRLAFVNPALVPLLRQPADVGPGDETRDDAGISDEQADRAPARGIMIGIALSTTVWLVGIAAFLVL